MPRNRRASGAKKERAGDRQPGHRERGLWEKEREREEREKRERERGCVCVCVSDYDARAKDGAVLSYTETKWPRNLT